MAIAHAWVERDVVTAERGGQQLDQLSRSVCGDMAGAVVDEGVAILVIRLQRKATSELSSSTPMLDASSGARPVYSTLLS